MSNFDDRNDADAVRVIVRERPARDFQGFNDDATSVISYLECSANILVADGRPFTFDKVLDPTATQEQLFVDVRTLVGKVTKGYNCTALAYGQTGTGKSYSMGLNSNASEGEQVGIIPRCLLELFNLNANDDNSRSVSSLVPDPPIEMFASFIEIYNEKVFDLLSDNTTEPIISRGYKYTGGNRKILRTMEDCYSILQQGNKNRHVRPTKMNAQSSRSHAIFTIHISSVSEKGVRNTKLNLVDLAGSEGVRRTGHQGVAMSEGVHINQGLLSIGKVLQAKALGNKVIPYRDSVLTSVLQDSLNENSYLTLLACISPHRADLTETLSTLRFAQCVKQLKHSPHVNLILAESKVMNDIVKKKNRPKTPKKPAMTPAFKKRPYSKISMSVLPKTVNPAYHSNTFCTPNKLKRNVLVDKLNHSEMGLTPKQKEKVRTGMIAPLFPGPSAMYTNLPLINRETSITMDRSLDSRASIQSLNISSSTMFGNDGATSSKPISYSPVVRKCMAEIENVMENKMAQLLESLKENFDQRTMVVGKTPCSTPWTVNSASAEQLPLVLRKELKSIIAEVLKENGSHSNTISDNGNDIESLLESSLLRNDPKCQLFTTSSPVFKVPAVPNKDSCSAKKSNEFCELTAETSALLDSSICSKVAMRRSRRISQRIQQNSLKNISRESGQLNKTLRRSRRISTMRDQIEVQLSTDCAEASKSYRKSLMQLHIERRQSIRHAAHLEVLEADEENGKVKNYSKQRKTAKHSIADLNNSVIESYFANDRKKSAPNNKAKKSIIQKHRKAILDLLNTGSMKELQILPQIGRKTAFQLVTQRTLSGKFKNLTQLEKLPIWRGNSWTRFAQANLLQD